MLGLALVQNLLTAVGAGLGRSRRPNFPLPPHAYPAGIRMELLPFNEQALRHFIYLERPDGSDMADSGRAPAAVEKAEPLPPASEDEIGPRLQDFPDDRRAVPRRSRSDFNHLANPRGSARRACSSGRGSAQAARGAFPAGQTSPAVTDLASAHAAIATIVEQGEGARGEWRDAHFGRLVTVSRRVPRLCGDQGRDLRAGAAGARGVRARARGRTGGAPDHGSVHELAASTCSTRSTR